MLDRQRNDKQKRQLKFWKEQTSIKYPEEKEVAIKKETYWLGLQETFEKAKETVLAEIILPEGVPGGQAAYRMTLAASFVHKFYL